MLRPVAVVILIQPVPPIVPVTRNVPVNVIRQWAVIVPVMPIAVMKARNQDVMPPGAPPWL